MVSCLIDAENISHVGNPCCLFHFTVLWARVRMGHVCPTFMNKVNDRILLYMLCVCDALNGLY